MSSDLPEVLEGVCDPYKMTILTADPASFVARAVSIPGFTDDGIGVVVGGPFWVETVPLRTDKAAGVALVCAELGFSAESCVSVVRKRAQQLQLAVSMRCMHSLCCERDYPCWSGVHVTTCHMTCALWGLNKHQTRRVTRRQ